MADLHRVPTKQLAPEVMEEGEDAALLGSPGAATGEVATSDGVGGVSFDPPGTPGAHETTHRQSGSDEIEVQDLSSGAAPSGDVLTAQGGGALAFATPGAPGAHAITHEDGQSDELTVQNLGSGGAAAGEVLTAQGGGALAFTSPTSDMFVKRVGGTSPDFADISAALSSLESGAAKKGILLIGAPGTAWGSTVVTLTKPVTFIGTVENAGFTVGASGQLTIDLPNVDEGTIELENIDIARSGGDNGIIFAQSTILKFRKCLVSVSDGAGDGLFSTLGTAANGHITVFAEDTDFQGDTPGATASRIFFISNATGNFEAHLKNCTWFNTAGNGATFAETAGGNVDLFLADGCVLHRPGILTISGGTLDVHYKDGSSLVTDFVSGGIGLANSISGLVSVHGEETYTTDMDTFSAEIDMERVFQEHMGLTLNIGPGTFTYAAEPLISKNDVTIRGAGEDSTTLSFSGTTANALLLSAADRNTIQDLKFKLTGAGSGSGINGSGDDIKIRNITIDLDVDKLHAINVNSLRGICEKVRVKSTTNTANTTGPGTIQFFGNESVIRGCFVDHTGVLTTNQTLGGITIGSGDRIKVENNHVVGNINAGIISSGDEGQIIGNYIDQGDVDFADRAGVIAISCSGRDNLISNNYMQDIGEFGIRILGTAQRTTVTANHVKGGQSGSIGIEAEVVSADNIIIKGNTVENGVTGQASIGTGIKLVVTGTSSTPKAVVKGNTIQRVLIVGIDVDYSTITSGDIQGPSISDNDIIFNNQTALIGIRVLGNSVGAPIVGGAIDNNRIFMGTSISPGNGITVQFIKDFSISGNQLEGRETTTGSNGIQLDDSKETQVNCNRVLGFENGLTSLSTGSGDSDNNQYGVNHLTGFASGGAATNFAANETNRDEVFNKV